MYGFSDNLIREATTVLQKARGKGLKIATAESCTGGLISALLTEIPGSSDVFDRGFVTYSNAAKIEMLGVNPATLEKHGAVSREVALQMAKGAVQHSNADIAVSVTGIAGPDGGSREKPVGLVWFAIYNPNIHTAESRYWGAKSSRASIRYRTIQGAVELIRNNL